MLPTYRLKRSWLTFVAEGLLLVTVVGLSLTLRAGTILSVQTASMMPIVAPGDALFVKQSPKSLQVGQVVTYRSHRDPRQLISHRIVSLDPQQQKLITKGDALAETDPPIRNWDVIGRVVFVVPRAGYGVNAIITWPGLIIAVYIPSLGILIIEVKKLCRPIAANHAKYRIYHSTAKRTVYNR